MKIINKTIYLGIIFLGIVGIFAPYIIINNSILSVFDLCKNYQINGIISVIFITFLLFISGSILLLFFNRHKTFIYISFILILVASILFTFSKNIISKSLINSYSITLYVTPMLLAIVGFLISVYLATLIFDSNSLNIRDIVEIAIFVSFAMVLDLPIFKVKIGATGGSISLVMLPLIIIALRKGFIKGFIATGIVYGLVNCLMDGYGFIYYPFDYLLGFGSIAIVGLFNKLIFSSSKPKAYFFLFLSVLLALCGRTLAATISGILFYQMNFISSLAYQLLYIAPSGGICFACVAILYPAIVRVNRIFPSKTYISLNK